LIGTSTMRSLLALLLLAAVLPVFAQSGARPRPPGTAALDEPPPPPPMVETDPALEPQVTIRKEATATITEYRVRGKLFMMRVTPAKGPAYVLIDHRGDGQFARQDNLDPGVRVPQWVLIEF
jgi:hypothetical protein